MTENKIIADPSDIFEVLCVLRKVVLLPIQHDINSNILTESRELYSKSSQSKKHPSKEVFNAYLDNLYSVIDDTTIQAINKNITRLRDRADRNTKTVEISEEDHFILKDIKEYIEVKHPETKAHFTEIVSVAIQSFITGDLDDALDVHFGSK